MVSTKESSLKKDLVKEERVARLGVQLAKVKELRKEYEGEFNTKLSEASLKKDLAKEKKIINLEEQLAKAKELRKEFGNELNDRMVTFLTTAFGVVAALFWQTAITDSIKAFIPTSGIWIYEIFVALAVTIIAVVGIFLVSKVIKKPKK